MIETLKELCLALRRLQQTDRNSPDFGAVWCERCRCYHTRAAEALFPFAVLEKHNSDQHSPESAIILGNWLISRQQPKGFWFETPNDWKGTTVFQLMSLAAAYPHLDAYLSDDEKKAWINAIRSAACWIRANIREWRANMNYTASASAALMLAYHVVPEEKLRRSAAKFARKTAGKINSEGFICGEGKIFPLFGREGVDIGYNLEMSLGALAIYARLSGDDAVRTETLRAVETHLKFMYPDGSLDDSWGSRSYKWTLYGSKTAHGSQMALEILSKRHPEFRRFSEQNLQFLKNNMKNGLPGNGPHSWWDPEFIPCIYPAFTRAAAIAFALDYSKRSHKHKTQIPDNLSETDNQGKVVELFQTVNICRVRTTEMNVTISGYHPVFIRFTKFINSMNDFITSIFPFNPFRIKLHPPTGGTISMFYHRKFGLVQASSPTRYFPVEAMHMPEVRDYEPLTSCINIQRGKDVFSNLYERYPSIETGKKDDVYTIRCRGMFKSKTFHQSGASYELKYELFRDRLVKTITLKNLHIRDEIEIREPVVLKPGMEIKQNKNIVSFFFKDKKCIFECEKNADFHIENTENESNIHVPFPDLYARPIKIRAKYPGRDEMKFKYWFRFE